MPYMAVGAGDIPSWISAGAATLGLLLGGYAIHVLRQGGSATSDRLASIEAWRRRIDEDRDRAQAERVCAWAVSERETFQKVIEHGVVGAAVYNASSTPVYAVELVYRDPDAAWTSLKRIPMVPPSTEPQVYAGFDEESTSGEPKPDRLNPDGTVRLALSADMRVELRFTDAGGRRWVRTQDGALASADG